MTVHGGGREWGKVSGLQAAVTEADDIDDEIAPVAWGECRNYSQTDDAAIVVAGVTAWVSASAAARAEGGTC